MSDFVENFAIASFQHRLFAASLLYISKIGFYVLTYLLFLMSLVLLWHVYIFLNSTCGVRNRRLKSRLYSFLGIIASLSTRSPNYEEISPKFASMSTVVANQSSNKQWVPSSEQQVPLFTCTGTRLYPPSHTANPFRSPFQSCRSRWKVLSPPPKKTEFQALQYLLNELNKDINLLRIYQYTLKLRMKAWPNYHPLHQTSQSHQQYALNTIQAEVYMALPGRAVSPINPIVSALLSIGQGVGAPLTAISLFSNGSFDFTLVDRSRILTQKWLTISTGLEHARRVHSLLERVALPAEDVIAMGRISSAITHTPLYSSQ